MKKKLMFVAATTALLTLAPLSPASAQCPPPEEGQPCDIQPYDPPGLSQIYCKVLHKC